MSLNNPPDNSSNKEIFFDDIPELDTLPISDENELRIEDYLIDDDLVEFVSPTKNQKTSNSPEPQASEITENEILQTSNSGAILSTSTAEGESTKEVSPTEVVKYDYIFIKRLTATDLKSPMRVPIRAAEKHLPQLSDLVRRTYLYLYDFNSEQRREWEFSFMYRVYFISVNWKKCVEDNGLEKGDRIIFYKTQSGQIVGNHELPRYVVKFKKPRETIDTESLYIPVHKLV